MSNDFISDYIRYYCNLEFPPEYAILLDGDWGIGKTWFIKKTKSDLLQNGIKCIYISLYGINSIQDINNEFFVQLHPVLSSKPLQLSAKVVKGFLKTAVKIDLFDDTSTTTTLFPENPALPEFLKNAEKNIIIFDDLERCSIPSSQTLGYINQLIEHNQCKVIIIANEQKIPPEDKDNFLQIKEKVVGKTFGISPEIDCAVKSFIENIESSRVKAFYQDNVEIIVELFKDANYKNLRHLKQGLLDFERLFLTLPESTFSKYDLIIDLLKLHLVFTFELKSGNIKVTDIKKIKKNISFYLQSNKGDDVSTIKNIFDRYTTVNFDESILSDSCWYDFFAKSLIEQNKIEECILSSRYFINDTTPNWKKLWHYFELTDAEFAFLSLKVKEELDQSMHENLHIVKHMAGMFIQFSKLGLVSYDTTEISDYFHNYINKLSSDNLLPIEINYEINTESWDGLGYIGRDHSEFNEFNKHLNLKVEESKNRNRPQLANELLLLMDNNAEAFAFQLILNNRKENLYFNTPILNHIDPNIFIEKLLKLKGYEFRLISDVLKIRYQDESFNKKLVLELDWLNSVKEILENYIADNNGKLSAYKIQLLLSNNIIPSINNLTTIPT